MHPVQSVHCTSIFGDMFLECGDLDLQINLGALFYRCQPGNIRNGCGFRVAGIYGNSKTTACFLMYLPLIGDWVFDMMNHLERDRSPVVGIFQGHPPVADSQDAGEFVRGDRFGGVQVRDHSEKDQQKGNEFHSSFQSDLRLG